MPGKTPISAIDIDTPSSPPKGAGQSAQKGAGDGRNEGEGSRTGTRAYNAATRDFIASGKVDKAARDAADALDGPEAETLKAAEAEGKRHSHGEDPALRKPVRH